MSLLELYKISNLFQWAGSIAVAACCLLHFSRRSLSIKMLAIYALVSILSSLAQKMAEWLHVDYVNLIGNMYVLLEAWILSMLFYYAMKNTPFGKAVRNAVVIYSLFYSITFLFFSDQSISFVRFGRDILMIICALIYFFYLIRKLPEENLLVFPMFWVTASVIFFFSGTFILSLMRDYLVEVLKSDLTGFMSFRNFFRFGFCIVLAYAGWLDFKSLKSASVNS